MTTSFRHRDSDQVHKPIAGDFADATARLAGTFTVLDNEKFYRQLDDDSVWMLTDYTGPTFVQVNSSSSGGTSSLHSIDDPTDAYWAGGDLGFDLEFDANTSSLPSGVGWVNQDSSTYTERGGAGTIARASQAGDHNYLLTRSLSGAPSTWLMTGKLTQTGVRAAFNDAYIVLRESGSGKFMSLGWRTHDTPFVFKWTNPTTFSAAVATVGSLTIPVMYFRIRKNSGSSYDFEYSYDAGYQWRTVQSAYNVGAFITPDEIGFGMYNSTGEAMGVSCHWLRLR